MAQTQWLDIEESEEAVVLEEFEGGDVSYIDGYCYLSCSLLVSGMIGAGLLPLIILQNMQAAAILLVAMLIAKSLN